MKHTFFTNFATLMALQKRELKRLKSQFLSIVIDGFVLVCCQTLLVGYFNPIMGMPQQMVVPVYLGTICLIIFTIGESAGFKTCYDLKFSRFIDYHIQLPLPKLWVAGHYILTAVIEMFLTTVPLFLLGFVLLGRTDILLNTNWFIFALIYILLLFFFAELFFALPLLYPFEWFVDNCGPRRLMPLLFFSAVFTPWAAIQKISPLIATLFLLNPLTYISEGLRASFLPSGKFIPISYCVIALIIFNGIAMLLVAVGMKRKLDPV